MEGGSVYPFLFLKCCWTCLEGLGAANVAEGWKDATLKGSKKRAEGL